MQKELLSELNAKVLEGVNNTSESFVVTIFEYHISYTI